MKVEVAKSDLLGRCEPIYEFEVYGTPKGVSSEKAAGLLTSDREVASRAFYDFSGRHLVSAPEGPCIERISYTDGTTDVVKVAGLRR